MSVGLRVRLRVLVVAAALGPPAAAVAGAHLAARGLPAGARVEARRVVVWGAAAGLAAGLVAGGAAAAFAGRELARARARLRTGGSEGRLGRPRRARLAELDALVAATEAELAELRERAAAGARAKAELAALLDAVADGVVQVGRDGRVVRANAAARALLGLPPDAEGRPLDALVRHAALRELLAAAAAGRAAGPVEAALERRRVRAVARPVEGGGVVVLTDLTELRRLEAVRRDFVANASHELKTPLTSIRGYTETLLAGQLPAEVERRFLETVRENAERLQRIVDDLLDLSRLESGAWQPELEEVDAGPVAEEAWAPFRDRAAAKGVAFAVVARGAPRALADPAALRQIFTNLFDNALRHTSAGGRIEVRIRAVGSGDGPGAGGAAGAGEARGPSVVVIEVADTGTGIPGHALPRIFERFYRVDPARSRAEGGTGLGLSIVRHLVEAMGGEVGVESELGRGTTIRLRLPAA